MTLHCGGELPMGGSSQIGREHERRPYSSVVMFFRQAVRAEAGLLSAINNAQDAPKSYGPNKTLYNRFVRWSLLGVFDRIFTVLACEGAKTDRIMIDATHLKAHRTAASLAQKGAFPVVWGEQRAA
jgi:transposase